MKADVAAYEINHHNLRQLLIHARKVLKLSSTDLMFIVTNILREIEVEVNRGPEL